MSRLGRSLVKISGAGDESRKVEHTSKAHGEGDGSLLKTLTPATGGDPRVLQSSSHRVAVSPAAAPSHLAHAELLHSADGEAIGFWLWFWLGCISEE